MTIGRWLRPLSEVVRGYYSGFALRLKRRHSSGANYVLAVKDNQPTLAEDVERAFAEAPPESLLSFGTEDEGHGRVEVREYFQCLDLSRLRTASEWPGLKSLGKVVSWRFLNGGGMSVETRYYISSLACGVKRMASGIRSHWGIENRPLQKNLWASGGIVSLPIW